MTKYILVLRSSGVGIAAVWAKKNLQPRLVLQLLEGI
jgi:hypothetical protein